MKTFRVLLLAALFGTAPAWGQQAKTTEQQARSYILSAFMTGAAPMVLSDDVKVSPVLRDKLHLPPEADSRMVYLSIVQQTAGRSLNVRFANDEEKTKAEAQTAVGRPVFALDVANSIYVMQYDLERDSIISLADASRPVAVTSPVTAPTQPQALVEKPAEATRTQPLPGARVQVIEPREPRVAQPPAPAMRPTSVPATQTARVEPPVERLRPSGPCVIKPVMSDQDLVNCGGSPR
jgi:hypothetical protein